MDTKEWENKAGGYAIQGSASCFIPWINGSYTGTMGFPINEVNNLSIISLGPRILRSDTAIVSSLSLFHSTIGDWV